jgi:sensor domain CHASE-containing protein
MSDDVEELLNDIRKVRNDLVAQANPHFQSLTNIIYKWETKLATREEKNE